MTISHRSRLLHDRPAPRRHQVYDGSEKTVYDGPEPETFVLYFKDDVVDPISDKKSTVEGKGVINNRISELLLTRLRDIGVESHFIKRLNMREQLVRAADVFPFQIRMNNIAAGSFSDRLGLDEGIVLPRPIPEFVLKSKELGYPIVSERHISTLGWAREDEIEDILSISQRVNDFLYGQFLALGIRLVNFTLEFGRLYPTELMDDMSIAVVDEISPDTCYLIDIATGDRLDQGNFFVNPKDAALGYQDVARRLGILTEGGPADLKEPHAIYEVLIK